MVGNGDWILPADESKAELESRFVEAKSLRVDPSLEDDGGGIGSGGNEEFSGSVEASFVSPGNRMALASAGDPGPVSI